MGYEKLHEKKKSGLRPFCRVLLVIDLSTCKLAKFFTILTPLTENEYIVTNLFHFVEEICKQDPSLYKARIDVDSLFNNILLEETIDICIGSLYNDNENILNILKDVFGNLLSVATKESFFIFHNKLYKFLNGVYTNFNGLVPGLIKSLLFRCFSLCSDFVKFHHIN